MKSIVLAMSLLVAAHAGADVKNIPLKNTEIMFAADGSNFRLTRLVVTKTVTALVGNFAAEEKCRQNIGSDSSMDCDKSKSVMTPVVVAIVEFDSANDLGPIRFQLPISQFSEEELVAIKQSNRLFSNKSRKVANRLVKLNVQNFVATTTSYKYDCPESGDCKEIGSYPSKVNKVKISVSR